MHILYVYPHGNAKLETASTCMQMYRLKLFRDHPSNEMQYTIDNAVLYLLVCLSNHDSTVD